MYTLLNDRIDNQYLEVLKNNYRRTFKTARDKRVNKVKIYEEDDTIVFQIKNTETRQTVCFNIYKKPNNNVIIQILLKDKNPNTIEYFDVPYSIKEIVITDEVSIHRNFLDSIVFLDTPSRFVKENFNKIKTCKEEKDLNDKNLLLRQVIDVVKIEDGVRIYFKETSKTFKITTDQLRYNRIPQTSDAFLTDINGRFQSQSILKAKYNFQF